MSKKRHNPSSYPKSVRELVQIDYAHKLNDAQQIWLAAFNEAEFGSNPEFLSELVGKKVTKAEKRKKWREIKRYQRDTMSQPCRLAVRDERSENYGQEIAGDDTSIFYNQCLNQEDVIIELLDNHAANQLLTKQTKERKKKNVKTNK